MSHPPTATRRRGRRSRHVPPRRWVHVRVRDRVGVPLQRRRLMRQPCVTNAEGGCDVGGIFHRRCCAGDGGLLALRRRPSGEGAKPPCAALAEDRRGERQGEGALDRVRWGPGRRSRKRPARGVSGWVCAVEASLAKSRWHRKRGVWLFSRDEPGGRPDDWPGGARREGGVSLVCGSGTEREKASVDTATGVAGLQGRERERAEADTGRH